MNLLIMSPGRRVEIVEYFKKTFHENGGKVFTLDMSKYAPALYAGDEYFLVEKDFSHLDIYIDGVVRICEENDIKAVITLIDPELVLLSEHRKEFEERGITLILSKLNFILDTFDKYQFYKQYSKTITLVETVGSYEDAIDALRTGKWQYPLFAKLRDGSASIGIMKIECEGDFESVKHNPKYIYQPFIDGDEYGADLYFDMISGKLVSVFIKKKISMRAGETDKAISVKSDAIVQELKKLESLNSLRGPIDVDVFVSKNGELFINEINPRFGGGHPHAYGCGVNFMNLILNNLNGIENSPEFNNYEEGIMMLKYNGLLFRKA